MPDLILRNIQYHPDTGAVAILLEHDFGSVFANTTEAALGARMTASGENWGNAEALAEAQAWIDRDPRLGGKGYAVVLAPRPAALAEAPAGVAVADSTDPAQLSTL